MLTSLRKSCSVSSFSIACFRFKAFAGKGNRTGMYAETFVSWILQLLLSNFYFFLLCLEDFFFTHDIYPHPHPPLTASTHYPRPTTFSYTRRRTLAAHARTQFAGLKVCRFRWRALNLPTCYVLFLVPLGHFLGCTSLVMFRVCILTGWIFL